MDHFEGIVLDYLRADRSLFINSQCCIQLNDGANPDTSGPHWYCDAVAVSFKTKSVFLCEVTYASSPASLMKRLRSWNEHWPALCRALTRDCALPTAWSVRPWIFIPREAEEKLLTFLSALSPQNMPQPKVTFLDAVLPWRYCSWNRLPEEERDAEGLRRDQVSAIGADGKETNAFLYELVDVEDTSERREATRKRLIELGVDEETAKRMS